MENHMSNFVQITCPDEDFVQITCPDEDNDKIWINLDYIYFMFRHKGITHLIRKPGQTDTLGGNGEDNTEESPSGITAKETPEEILGIA